MLNGTASGMIPMAIFTPVYAVWTMFAWPVLGTIFFIVALAFSIILFVTAIRMLRLSRNMPDQRNADDARIAKVMPLISNIMGFGILLAIILLSVLDLSIWILPTVATLVALHFYPMAGLFHRTIDYYLGTLMLLAALVGFVLAAMDFEWQIVWATTGVIGAVVTCSYGLNALVAARQILVAYRATS